MKEYGGYIELDTYRFPMLYENGIHLNCGRNALAYLIESRKIKKIAIPHFLCDSVYKTCKKYSLNIRFYHIQQNFHPEEMTLDENEYLYLVNYYGQLSTEYLQEVYSKFSGKVILDNAQAYFTPPVAGMDTLYTCRKFFGVADGAILYTDAVLEREFPVDLSFDRMRFLLGRFEKTASEFYAEYVANNKFFSDEPIKIMSTLTENLLHGIDYGFVKQRRTDNFRIYHEKLNSINQLELREVEGAFAYPLLIRNGAEVRRILQQKKIYISTLWPNVLNDMPEDSLEYRFAQDILPLPCDQRYHLKDITIIAQNVIKCIQK